ncbi:MAG: STAS domain-containing protein [Planctomycetota bacterium]
MHETQMKFELREAGPGYLVLTCRGGLSWEDRELLTVSVEQHLAERPVIHGLVLDMSNVEFVNSAGLGALFQLIQRLRERGGQLAFAHVPPTLRRLFSAVGLDRVVTFGDDISMALQALSESTPRIETDNTEPSQA